LEQVEELQELGDLEDTDAEPLGAEEPAAVAPTLPGVDDLEEFVGEIFLDEEVGPLVPELEWLEMGDAEQAPRRLPRKMLRHRSPQRPKRTVKRPLMMNPMPTTGSGSRGRRLR
jgi:hypothetical protein